MSYQNTLLVSLATLLTFCEEMERIFEIKFDTRLIRDQGQYWFWNTHPNIQKAEQLLALVEHKEFEGEFDEEVFEKLRSLAMERLPGNHETDAELFNRANLFKQHLISHH